ncbi:MAG: hypothetical protein PHF31_03560 [Methylobacter sp.]|nr:hypothetical protein [Methylobacter sp.]
MDSKEIVQAWFRTGNSYTSNGVVEFVSNCWHIYPTECASLFQPPMAIMSVPYWIFWIRKAMVIQSNILNGMDRTALADLKN